MEAIETKERGGARATTMIASPTDSTVSLRIGVK